MTTALVTLEHGKLSNLRCLQCGGELELIQPNPLQPDRLLACCQAVVKTCGRWHLIDIRGEGTNALVILLPDPVAIQRTGAHAAPDHLQSAFKGG